MVATQVVSLEAVCVWWEFGGGVYCVCVVGWRQSMSSGWMQPIRFCCVFSLWGLYTFPRMDGGASVFQPSAVRRSVVVRASANSSPTSPSPVACLSACLAGSMVSAVRACLSNITPFQGVHSEAFRRGDAAQACGPALLIGQFLLSFSHWSIILVG